MRAGSLALAAAALVAAACGSFGEAGASGGLRTTFDSTGTDTVVATTTGSVPASLVRTLVDEMRIAPMADDTSLFGDVYEFEVGLAGRVYVYDETANAILLFDSTGALQRRIGRSGAGPGEFNGNGGMVVLPDGRLAQWDTQNARVSFFSPDGDFIKQWTVQAGFSSSDGLRTDSSGALLWYRPVTEPREGEILGRFGLVRLKDGGGIGDSLVPPDLRVQRITYVARSKDGSSTSATGPTHSPRFFFAWHPDGHYVSIASSRYRLESSRPGKALRIVRDAPPIVIPEDERAWDQEQITFGMQRNVPGWTWPGPPIPTEKPPVAGLKVARDGRIWVLVSTPSIEIPVADRDEQVANRRPVARWRQDVEYEVFERDGTFAGRVRFPRRATWMHAYGDQVWYLQRDEDGLPAIVRARVELALR